jgi:hypothetical protein
MLANMESEVEREYRGRALSQGQGAAGIQNRKSRKEQYEQYEQYVKPETDRRLCLWTTMLFQLGGL